MDPNNENNQEQSSPAAQPVQSPIARQFSDNQNAQADNIPDSWPGAFGIFKNSKNSVMKNLGFLAIVYVGLFALNIIFSVLGGTDESSPQYLASNIVLILLSLPATVLLYRGLIAGVKNQKTDFNQASANILLVSVKLLALFLITYAIALVSLFALIIPFFFIVPRISMAGFYLLEDNLGPVESIKASWHATKGHVGKVYGVIGASIVMILPVFTFIGIPVAIYLSIMYAGALVVLFMYIKRQAPPASRPSK